MNDRPVCPEPSEEDFRAALKQLKGYLDITEEDLRKVYEVALRHARERLLLSIPVRDIMTRIVVTASRDMDIREAARLLSEHKISGMPVVDRDMRVIGVISEADILFLAGINTEHRLREILRRLLGEPQPVRKTGEKVADIMSIPPITALADDDVRRVAAVLDERRIKRLPVVDGEGKLIGVISRADIVRAVGKKQ
ncbi:MAG TPA: CBS domain-containing protein [Nitrospirota bacterium]|nr:CBS domain-containing protein [Nitrospirota bacterium]